MPPPSLQVLREYGQAAWLDGLAAPAELERLAERGIRGAIAGAGARTADARRACDALLPLWQASRGRDGLVSVAQPLDRANALLAVPARDLRGIEAAVAAGRSVDATPARSVPWVAEAYMRGLERLLASGGDPRRVTAVASVPVAALDAEVDRRLARRGADAARLRGRLAIANARLAHRRCRFAFAGGRWEALAAQGAQRMRCLWRGTATRGTPYRDVLYAEELIGADTILALAPDTLAAFEDHGVVADRLERAADDPARVVREIAHHGIDLDDVWRVLEA